jgi:predicted dehydrogenase
VKEMKLEELEPLKEELRSFVDCVRNDRCPLVTGEDGVRSMETAERILASSREHDWSV